MAEKVITFSKDQLDAMDSSQLMTLLLKATKIQATCVVQRADGSIKYDDPNLAGSYNEQFLRGEDRTDG